LPLMKIQKLHAFAIAIPQKPPIAPYQSRYRAGSVEEAILVRLETDSGHVGWGETPVDWINRSFEGTPEEPMRREARARDPFDSAAWHAENTLGPFLSSAVEMAMWDIIGHATNQPLYRLLGGAVRKRIELAACMGIRPYEEAKTIARLYVEQGFTTLKTKAGRRAEEDLEMVRGIRAGVGHRLNLRIAPNLGYAPEVAFPRARDLENYTLKSSEQPMPPGLIAAHARLRRHGTTPIGLNESVTMPEVVLQSLQL